jgi:hypothetical protein
MPAVPKPPPPRNPPKKGRPKKIDTTEGSFSTKTEQTRTGKGASLETKVSIFYKMMGTFLIPIGKWYSAAGSIGKNLTKYSDDAAEAWMELADENPEVKRMLESLTSASAWGNVIGVHFAIAVDKDEDKPLDMNNPIDVAKAMGIDLSPEDLAAVAKLTGNDKGGPGDTIRSERPVQEAVVTPPPEPVVTPPPVPQPVKSGIASPEQLGVDEQGKAQSNAHENIMPASSGPIQGGKPRAI